MAASKEYQRSLAILKQRWRNNMVRLKLAEEGYNEEPPRRIAIYFTNSLDHGYETDSIWSDFTTMINKEKDEVSDFINEHLDASNHTEAKSLRLIRLMKEGKDVVEVKREIKKKFKPTKENLIAWFKQNYKKRSNSKRTRLDFKLFHGGKL